MKSIYEYVECVCRAGKESDYRHVVNYLLSSEREITESDREELLDYVHSHSNFTKYESYEPDIPSDVKEQREVKRMIEQQELQKQKLLEEQKSQKQKLVQDISYSGVSTVQNPVRFVQELTAQLYKKGISQSDIIRIVQSAGVNKGTAYCQVNGTKKIIDLFNQNVGYDKIWEGVQSLGNMSKSCIPRIIETYKRENQ